MKPKKNQPLRPKKIRQMTGRKRQQVAEFSGTKKGRPIWNWVVAGVMVITGIVLLMQVGFGYRAIMAERQILETGEAVEDQKQKQPALFQSEFFGSGDLTIELELPKNRANSVGIASIAHTGSGDFSIWTLYENQERQQLLRKIGNYTGTVLFKPLEGAPIFAFEIVADGPWTVTLRDPRSLEEIKQGSVATGQGDEVLFYNGESTVATVSHEGKRNFSLRSGIFTSSVLLVKGIGSFSGQVPLRAGPVMIEMRTNGVWTIELD
jgi:hypothetical protein